VSALKTDTTGRCRFYVKAAGEWTGTAGADGLANGDTKDLPPETTQSSTSIPKIVAVNQKRDLPGLDVSWTADHILEYKPSVKKGEWFLSEIDLEWIAAGCYILGCGGGGSPTHDFLALREMVRRGETIRVIDLASVSADDVVGWGGGIGSPEVSAERLMGEE